MSEPKQDSIGKLVAFLRPKWNALSGREKAIVCGVIVVPFLFYSLKSRPAPVGPLPSSQGVETAQGNLLPKPPAAANAQGAPVAQQGRVEVFLTGRESIDGSTPIQGLARLQKASFLNPFAVVAGLSNFQAGSSLKVGCEVTAPDGAKIVCDPVTLEVGTSSLTPWAYFYITPVPGRHQPGGWKVAVTVNGTPAGSTVFQLEAPNSIEQRVLAEHEEAVVRAKEVFSHFWMGLPYSPPNGQARPSFVTAIFEQPKDAPAVQKPLVSDQQFSLIANGVATQDADTPAENAIPLHLFQVLGLYHDFEQDLVTEADELNGISYRGKALFSFTLYREFLPQNQEWTPWRELDRPSTTIGQGFQVVSHEFMRRVGPIIGLGNQLAPCMKLQLQKRDGHWLVETQEGHQFLDGKEIPQNTAYLYKGGSLRSGIALQPSRDVVKRISQNGVTERSKLLELGKMLRATPDVAKQQEADTLEYLK